MPNQKPMLACDAKVELLKFPMYCMHKIDGVRAINFEGETRPRSLKSFPNKLLNKTFNRKEFIGFDGEMIASSANDSELCRKTTSVVSTIENKDPVFWCLFDYITDETKNEPYYKRLETLKEKWSNLPQELRNITGVLNHYEINNAEMLEEFEEYSLSNGYEGVIIRNPLAPYKYGRSTAKEQGLLRLKRFIEEEAIVVSINEGEENQNEAVKNKLGRIERSTKKENMIPNGMVGSLKCQLIKDITVNGLCFDKGFEFIVSAGKLTANERKYYWENQKEIIGKVIKFKSFSTGLKDTFRFPTFQGFRLQEDM